MSIDMSRSLQAINRDSRWLTEHYDEIRNDDGKVIAVKDEKVILETKEYAEMLDGLNDMGEDPAFLVIEVFPSKSDSFIL